MRKGVLKMKSINVDSIEELKKILEAPGSDSLVINLENKVYELYESIHIKRSGFTLNGNGATIKGSRKIDLSGMEKANGIVKISLKDFGIPVKSFHDVKFPWCGELFAAVPRDPFGTAVTASPRCGGVSSSDGYAGPDIELFYKGSAMPVSRYPREGYIDIKETLSEEEQKDPTDIPKGGAIGIIVPDDDRFTKMEKAEEALLFGYWSFDWSPHHHAVKRIDAENNIVEVDGPYDFWGYWDARGQDKLRGRFYATNVFEALDEPGTWFVDRKNEELYIHPYEGQTEVDISACDTLFIADDVSNMEINGLKLYHCKSCGFSFKNVTGASILNTSIENMGEWGIVADKSTDIKIIDCKIAHTGAGGIFLCGGDRVSLTSSGNMIKDSEITDVGKWYKTYTSGIEIRGVNAVVSGCKLHALPHFAILFTGNNHIIENNEIYDVCRLSNDAGAIYSGKDYTFYGNIIRHNYFHDFYGLENKGCTCLYFDDCMSSAEVYGNIFANLAHAIQLGGGHDFKIHHNSFYNCDFLLLDNRGRCGFWLHTTTEDMRGKLKSSPYKNVAWKNAFPELYNADIDSDAFFLPYGNSITDNTFISCGDILMESPDITAWVLMKNNTFVKRSRKKVYSKSNTCHNLNYLLKAYTPMELE